MAGTSPRRSSRAKATVPPLVTAPQSSTSSANSSARSDRKNKNGVAQGTIGPSTTPGTSTEASSEHDHTEDGRRQTRHNKQTADSAADTNVKGDNNHQEEGDEGGSIRCLCRKSDYPGPPLPSDSHGRNTHTKEDQHLMDLDPNDYSEEAGGLFIACDSCLTWQHGGCVGIFGQEMIPKDDYYCWRCRKDLHKLFTGARGRRYSKYLPATEAEAPKPLRKQSFQREAANRSAKNVVGKTNRSNGETPGEKRRSTMNSRSAWDEDEILRRALEESKGMSHNDGSTSGTRKGKRGRDNGNDEQHPTKRRRTDSDTGSSQQPKAEESPEKEDQEEKTMAPNSRRARTTNGQSQQDDEARQKEERERERVEAANKRKGRAERRRADESEPPEDGSKPTSNSKISGSAAKATRAQQATRQTAVTSSVATSSTSHRKASKAAGRKGKVGRNQYTRDRDAIADARAEAGRASHSREGEENGEGQARLLSNGSRPSKPRHMNINRTSMNEIRKRAAGIFEYLSSTQVAMAGEKTPSDSSSPPRGSSRPGLLRGSSVNGSSKLSNEILGDEPESSSGKEANTDTKMDEATFRQLSSLEMMDVIAREIVLWQKDFGKYGEK